MSTPANSGPIPREYHTYVCPSCGRKAAVLVMDRYSDKWHCVMCYPVKTRKMP